MLNPFRVLEKVFITRKGSISINEEITVTSAPTLKGLNVIPSGVTVTEVLRGGISAWETSTMLLFKLEYCCGIEIVCPAVQGLPSWRLRVAL